MKNNNLTCKTDLQENIISQEVFDKELAICKQLSAKGKGRCCWGKCKSCGVIPLLYKLHQGKLLEDEQSIIQAKNDNDLIV